MYKENYGKKNYFETFLNYGDEIVKEGRMIYTDMEYIKTSKFNQRKKKNLVMVGKSEFSCQYQKAVFIMHSSNIQFLTKCMDMKLMDKKFQNLRT
jgi:hypothetical protein